MGKAAFNRLVPHIALLPRISNRGSSPTRLIYTPLMTRFGSRKRLEAAYPWRALRMRAAGGAGRTRKNSSWSMRGSTSAPTRTRTTGTSQGRRLARRFRFPRRVVLVQGAPHLSARAANAALRGTSQRCRAAHCYNPLPSRSLLQSGCSGRY